MSASSDGHGQREGDFFTMDAIIMDVILKVVDLHFLNNLKNLS
jgi:hypothetical protein